MTGPSDPFQLVGTTLDGKYRVDRVLGEGGFGVVYAGFHVVIGQPIAIKCLKPLGGASADEQRSTDLFLREARVLFSLTHPSIVRLYDVGTIATPLARVPYVVLELLADVSLEREISDRSAARAPLTLHEIGAILEPVLDAVAFAHERSIIHRDLKPSNVMLLRAPTGLSAKVLDFGTARVGPQTHSVGQTGFTPRYASPEQWDPSLGPTSPASDVFSLGLVLAEMCTLSPLLAGNTPSLILAAVLNPARQFNLSAHRPDLPRALAEVLSRATRYAPAERYPSAREMHRALKAALDSPAHLDASPLAETRSLPNALPAPAPPSSSSSLLPIFLVVGGALALIAAVGSVIGYKYIRKDPAAASAPASAGTPGQPPDPAKHAAGTVQFARILVSSPGAYTEGQLMDAIAPHLGNIPSDVHECYAKALESEPTTSGELTLSMMTDAAGTLTYVEPVPDGVVGQSLRGCVAARAKGWKLPKPKGKQGTFLYTMLFKNTGVSGPAVPAKGPIVTTSRISAGSTGNGGFTESQLLDLVDPHLRDIPNDVRACYLTALQKEAFLAGDLSFSIVLNDAGSVLVNQPLAKGIEDTALRTCVQARIATWTFPKPNGKAAFLCTLAFHP